MRISLADIHRMVRYFKWPLERLERQMVDSCERKGPGKTRRALPDEGLPAARGKRPPRVEINDHMIVFGSYNQSLNDEIDSSKSKFFYI